MLLLLLLIFLFVCTVALSLQDISNALLWFFLQILTIIYRPFLTSSHLMWCWKINIMEHVSLLTVQNRRFWQQNHHCSRGFSKFIPFSISPDKPLPLVLLFLLLQTSFFKEKSTSHRQETWHCHALQDLTMYTGHGSPPVQSVSSTHPFDFPVIVAGRRKSNIRVHIPSNSPEGFRTDLTWRI